MFKNFDHTIHRLKTLLAAVDVYWAILIIRLSLFRDAALWKVYIFDAANPLCLFINF